jgi:hypothetical protein
MTGKTAPMRRKRKPQRSNTLKDNGRLLGMVPSGKWLEFGLALSPGSTKVSFQAARSIG